jgi:hypothetical protein
MSHQQHQTGNVTVPSTDTLRTIERRERGLALNATAKRYLGALRTGRGITGLSFLAVLVALALLAPILFPGGYDQQSANAFAFSAPMSSAATCSSERCTACGQTCRSLPLPYRSA